MPHPPAPVASKKTPHGPYGYKAPPGGVPAHTRSNSNAAAAAAPAPAAHAPAAVPPRGYASPKMSPVSVVRSGSTGRPGRPIASPRSSSNYAFRSPMKSPPQPSRRAAVQYDAVPSASAASPAPAGHNQPTTTTASTTTGIRSGTSSKYDPFRRAIGGSHHFKAAPSAAALRPRSIPRGGRPSSPPAPPRSPPATPSKLRPRVSFSSPTRGYAHAPSQGTPTHGPPTHSGWVKSPTARPATAAPGPRRTLSSNQPPNGGGISSSHTVPASPRGHPHHPHAPGSAGGNPFPECKSPMGRPQSALAAPVHRAAVPPPGGSGDGVNGTVAVDADTCPADTSAAPTIESPPHYASMAVGARAHAAMTERHADSETHPAHHRHMDPASAGVGGGGGGGYSTGAVNGGGSGTSAAKSTPGGGYGSGSGYGYGGGVPGASRQAADEHPTSYSRPASHPANAVSSAPHNTVASVSQPQDDPEDNIIHPFARRDIVVRGSFVVEGCNYTKYDVGTPREADRRAFTAALRDDITACIGQGVRRHDIMLRAAPGPVRNVTLEYSSDGVATPAIVDADWGIEFEYAIRMRSETAAQTAAATLYQTFQEEGLDLQEARHAWLRYVDPAADPERIYTLSSQDARRM